MCGQPLLHFAVPIPKPGPECAVGRRMRVTADDRGAWQRKALFRSDNMYDALADVVHSEERNTEFVTIVLQCLNLLRADRIRDAELRAVVGTL